jgi:hypothetical protein
MWSRPQAPVLAAVETKHSASFVPKRGSAGTQRRKWRGYSMLIPIDRANLRDALIAFVVGASVWVLIRLV